MCRSRGYAQGPYACSNENWSLGWVFQEVVKRRMQTGIFLITTSKEMVEAVGARSRKGDRKKKNTA